MRKGLKKAAVLGLSAGLALTSVAGCSKKDNFDAEAAAVTVNDATVSAGVLNLAVRYNQAGYESMYMSFGLTDPFNQDLTGMGTTIGMDLKNQLATEMTHALLAEQKMSDYNVSVSDEDKEKIKAAAAGFIAANEEEVLKEMGVTQEIAERYLELITIQSRVEREMCADVDTEVSDEEAAQRKVQYVLFTPESETESEAVTEQESAEDTTEKVTEATTEAQTGSETETEAQTAALTENNATKTQTASETETEAGETETEAGETEKAVTASADGETEAQTKADDTDASTENETEVATEAETETEDPETAAAKERARVHAAEMIEKIKAGGDFEETATEMGKTANTTTFGADYSLTELVTATDGLADDTLVEEPIETASGYYVVKLVSQLDREATDNAKTNIVNQRKNDRISELYTEWTEDGDVSVDSEVLAKITFDYHLVLPEEEPETSVEEETEAISEVKTEAGTEASTEAKTEETETEEVQTESATSAKKKEVK